MAKGSSGQSSPVGDSPVARRSRNVEAAWVTMVGMPRSRPVSISENSTSSWKTCPGSSFSRETTKPSLA